GLSKKSPVAGCTNLRVIGLEGGLRPGCDVPNVVRWVHPSKDPGVNRVVPSDTGQVARESFREAHSLHEWECHVPTFGMSVLPGDLVRWPFPWAFATIVFPCTTEPLHAPRAERP